MELSGTIKTTIVCDDDKSHVYEIIRELDSEGEEVILLTLYPTLTTPNELDLSCMHLLNHADDPALKINKIRFVFLFSKVVSTKLSTRGLKMDHKNMEYLKKTIQENPTAKLVISYGSSMDKCPAVIQSKVELFKIVKELRPKDALWQIDAEGMEETATHILYAGIRYSSAEWFLSHYVIPYRFTMEGYQSYLDGKEEARQRFIENVLGHKKEEPVTQEDKPKKGKKKNENKEFA